MELVSIITPYYKKKKYIELTINSVLQQTYKNFELIIIYDDQNKEDLNLLKNLIKKDKRIKLYINKKNLGAGRSRNKGIKFSKGSLIAFLDSDDLWTRNKLKKQIFFMKKNLIDISHTSYHIINSDNKIIGSRRAKDMNHRLLLSSCDIGLSTVIMKKEIITNKIKFANINTKEDYVLWLKITLNNKKIFALKNNLTKWRKLNDSLSASKIQKLYDGYLVYRKYMNLSLAKSFIRLLLLSFNYGLKGLRNK
ncbi:glycosyltransferase family 2 protein [Candidatus Pelagibacter sp. Uisw_116]|uniref:glycosyltransferase family 2 protein n=1 Tax=Candidatus Pelagibacter sp. Uisw_116 TaxID=3230986 RepID=UPI0039EC9B94